MVRAYRLALLAVVAGCSPSPEPVAPVSSAPPPAASAGEAAATPEAATMTADEALAKLRVVSPTARELPVAGRAAVLDELGRTLDALRADGGDAIRIFGVRPDGLLGKLGLENGDRLEAIDDKPPTTETLTAAKSNPSTSLRVARRGATSTTLTLEFK
ncbi:MAG: hypothetical protein KIT84_17105 [Labilithrix sp.]|nr:hypothetical protein [Labilithrix sp.]MCW5812749.1 hypothetical protein [Labilithrix sp.]